MLLFPYTMCFSSSLICLLVVTCHGSIMNAYEAELLQNEEDGSKFHDTSHTSKGNATTLTSSDFHPLNTSHSTILNTGTSSSQTDVEPSSKIPTTKPLTELNRHRRQLDELIVSEAQSSSIRTNAHSSHDHHINSSADANVLNTGDFEHDENNHHEHNEHNHHEHDEHNHHVHGGKQDAVLNFEPCDPASQSEKDGDDDHKPSAAYHQHYPPNMGNISGKVWLYASLAVVAISFCGLFSVLLIPIMQKWFYHTLLQFLVGLAVGSLSGDGLLHLMPHAILDSKDSHDHMEGHVEESHQDKEAMAIWRGLAALCGIFLFFIAERLLGALAVHRRQKRETRLSVHPKITREDGANNGSVGEKLSQPKKNSYDHIKEKDEKETIQMLQSEASPSKKGSNPSVHEVGFHGRSSFSLDPEVSVAYRPESDSSVIVSEHHGHSHAHTHEIPQSVSAVAWMVIMGDGLHNFCDGLAIGAAFASGDADGLSTTVAVFCHELPHELGDFAMLLKTGMKVRQALFYNGLSSVLCFIGMVIGVCLGNVHSAVNWVFAGTAGMFLYIALVDMLPELSPPVDSSGTTNFSTLLVQFLGISIGIGIMLIIAIYEHELHSIIS